MPVRTGGCQCGHRLRHATLRPPRTARTVSDSALDRFGTETQEQENWPHAIFCLPHREGLVHIAERSEEHTPVANLYVGTVDVERRIHSGPCGNVSLPQPVHVNRDRRYVAAGFSVTFSTSSTVPSNTQSDIRRMDLLSMPIHSASSVTLVAADIASIAIAASLGSMRVVRGNQASQVRGGYAMRAPLETPRLVSNNSARPSAGLYVAFLNFTQLVAVPFTSMSGRSPQNRYHDRLKADRRSAGV